MENKSNDISWLDRIHKRFKEVGVLIPENQRKIYKKIREEWVMGRTVLDIGCSIGIGSNILSNGSRFVWGLDINRENIEFARQAFTRDNMEFEVFDIEKPFTKPYSTMEVIVCVEVLEHLQDVDMGLSTIKTFFGKDSIGFLTAPNTNNPDIKERDNKNELHLQHWTAGEFYDLLIKHFGSVTMYSVNKLDKWIPSETVDGSTTDDIIVAKVMYPL